MEVCNITFYCILVPLSLFKITIGGMKNVQKLE